MGLVPYDEENDEITLQFQWSTDEENWESFGSENYNYPYNVSFEWNSIDDISDEEVDLFVRVISQDGEDDNDKDTSLTWNFLLDNDQTQFATLQMAGALEEYTGNSEIQYTIVDESGDRLSMIVLFKSDTTDWDTLTMLDTDALVDLVPGVYQGSFTWQTLSLIHI